MRSAIRSSNRQASPTRRTSASRGTGFCEAKMAASTRSIHSRQRAAGGKSASSTSRLSSPLRWRRRAAALIGRTAGTWAGPKARARRRARRRRSNSRRAARPVIGAWRAASAGETQSWASSRSTIFCCRFRPQFGRDGDQGFGAAGKIGGEVEGGGGGERDRARGGVRPGGLARPWPPSAARRTAEPGPEFSSRSAAAGRGQRSRMAMTMSNTQSGEDFGFGRRGVREGGEGQGGGLARPPRPDRPPLRKPSGRRRGRSGPAEPGRAAPPRRRSGRGRGRAAGRRGRATAAAASPPGPSASPTAKRRSRSAPSSALRRRILAEAAAL